MTQKWIKVREIRERLGGVSKSYVMDLVANDPDFPKPIRSSAGKNTLLLFPLAGIEAWEKKKLREMAVKRRA